MTRTDLADKTIDKLENLEQAIELIDILNYDECLIVLNRVSRMPAEMFEAVIARAKSLKGPTPELIIASMQNLMNK